MKKLTIAILLIVLCVSTNYVDTHYKREGKIVDISNNEITILDTTNNTWIWIDETNSYTKGQKIIMSMHNNYTDENIYDDIIKNIRVVQ
jgi:uncharacterized protein YeeX (DUF496 family)